MNSAQSPKIKDARRLSARRQRSNAKDLAYLKLLATIVQRPFADVITTVTGNLRNNTPPIS